MTHPVDFPQEFPRWELKAALDSPSIAMPPGLSHEEKRQFILSHAAGVSGTFTPEQIEEAGRRAEQLSEELRQADARGAWGTSTVSTPEYQQEQREKNQRARDLLDGLARKGAE
jgi:hypothetical protein